MCGSDKHVLPRSDGLYWCQRCQGLFDNDPDEGGTHSDRNPAVRIEREERRQERKRVYQNRSRR